MAAPSYANAVFAALAQHRLQQQEEERIKKSQTLNLGSILAGALLGGLTGNRPDQQFQGLDTGWLKGALQGGLAGAGSSELEGGVGVAKGAMAGLQQGQNLRDYYTKQLAQQELQSALQSGDQKKIEMAGTKMFPEEVLKSKLKPSLEDQLTVQMIDPQDGSVKRIPIWNVQEAIKRGATIFGR